MSKVLITLAEKVYKLPEEKVAELTEKSEDEIAEFFIAEDAKRVKKLNTEGYDKGYRKAKVEAFSEFEKSVREEFDVSDTSLQGLELVKHVADAIKQGADAAGGSTEITEDAVKKHPAYVSLEKSIQAKVKEAEKSWKEKLEAKDKEYKQKEIRSKVKDAAISELDKLEPVLPEDAAKAQRIKDWWLNDLLANNFDVDEDGTINLLDKEGHILKDEQGYPVEFNTFLQGSITGSFELKQTKERSSPDNGGKGKDGKDGKKGKVTLPKATNLDELAKYMDSPDYTVEERMQIHADYEKATGSK